MTRDEKIRKAADLARASAESDEAVAKSQVVPGLLGGFGFLFLGEGGGEPAFVPRDHAFRPGVDPLAIGDGGFHSGDIAFLFGGHEGELSVHVAASEFLGAENLGDGLVAAFGRQHGGDSLFREGARVASDQEFSVPHDEGLRDSTQVEGLEPFFINGRVPADMDNGVGHGVGFVPDEFFAVRLGFLPHIKTVKKHALVVEFLMHFVEVGHAGDAGAAPGRPALEDVEFPRLEGFRRLTLQPFGPGDVGDVDGVARLEGAFDGDGRFRGDGGFGGEGDAAGDHQE